MSNNILKLLIENRVLWQANKFDIKYHATLTSGLHSGHYFNFSNLNSVSVIKKLLMFSGFNVAAAYKFVDCVCGQAYGSIALAVIMSEILNVPFVFTEKDIDGKMIFKRFPIDKYYRVLLVEDVITTGSTTVQTLTLFGHHPINPMVYQNVFTLVNRSGSSIIKTDRTSYGIDCVYDAGKILTYDKKNCPYCKAGSKPVEAKRWFGLLIEQDNG